MSWVGSVSMHISPVSSQYFAWSGLFRLAADTLCICRCKSWHCLCLCQSCSTSREYGVPSMVPGAQCRLHCRGTTDVFDILAGLRCRRKAEAEPKKLLEILLCPIWVATELTEDYTSAAAATSSAYSMPDRSADSTQHLPPLLAELVDRLNLQLGRAQVCMSCSA